MAAGRPSGSGRLFNTWAFTGAGSREVLGLRVDNVDLAERVIRFRSHPRRRLKTGARAAEVPIAPPLLGVLASWLPHACSEWLFPGRERLGPWFGGAPGFKPLDRVRQLGQRAGVEGLTILAFRHTVGTLAESWGLGELELQRLLRHSQRKTQRYYRHADAEIMARTAAKISYSNGSIE